MALEINRPVYKAFKTRNPYKGLKPGGGTIQYLYKRMVNDAASHTNKEKELMPKRLYL